LIDFTHDPQRTSWVASARGHSDFPVQNLPFGVFSREGELPRGGVAIGESILDLKACLDVGVLDGPTAEAAAANTLNVFMGLGAPSRAALRIRLFDLLSDDAPAAVRGLEGRLLHRAADCVMHLPTRIGDYTDFFAGIHHATNTGRLFRPDQPLLDNYKYLPIAYHGRASSVRLTGTPVHRPAGQRKRPGEAAPTHGPSRNLDYELELGVWIGPGNALGSTVPIGEAASHIAGFCLLNDWSARDIQGWEYQPLGPFLAKNFMTTISPWIVTPEALAPFRIPQPPRADDDPKPLPNLWSTHDQAEGAIDLELEVLIATSAMRAEGTAPHRLSIGNTNQLYWTPAQLVAHHTSGGCNLRPGDLFGSGTISTAEPAGAGSLLELTEGGRKPIELPSGTLRARATGAGRASIGFGECRGVVTG
jgi:fumarylacetoacetase